MNPHSKPRPLFFTPRTPWGRFPLKRVHHRHMRAHEDSSRALPEEDKDGRIQGKIESTGETHGKPENSFEFQVNSNQKFRDTGRQSDFLGEGRSGYDPHMAELERQRAREKKQRALQGHMRAHEDSSRALPEEDKDGRIQGKIESTGETHGKPENSFEFQVNSNQKFRDTGRQSDFLGEGRSGYDPHMAELEREKAAQEAQAKKAAEAAQKPKQPSKWKWTAPSASAQRVPGL